MKHIIAPSILAANFGKLDEAVELINKSEAAWLHIDVMVGRFVPNISFGFPVLEAIQKKCTKVLDVHLMIVEPEKYLKRFAESGAQVITVHYEACRHLHRTINAIKQLGCKAGVALNPHTPVQLLSNVLEELDLVCLMSVNPGYGGQSFIKKTYKKIEALQLMAKAIAKPLLIEIDGGVSLQNAPQLLKAGANVLVAGSSVFKSNDPLKTISDLKSINLNTLTV